MNISLVEYLLPKTPHRIELETLLASYLPRLQGSILDIGSKNRRYDLLLSSKPTAIDLEGNQSLQIQQGDVCDLNFQANHFDAIICLEVLEYLDAPKKALSEIMRVLKPGGTAIISMPFMYKYHDDRTRLTASYLQELLHSFADTTVIPIGNSYSIILDIIRYKLVTCRWAFLSMLFAIPYFLLQAFLPFARFGKKDTAVASGFLIIAKKYNAPTR